MYYSRSITHLSGDILTWVCFWTGGQFEICVTSSKRDTNKHFENVFFFNKCNIINVKNWSDLKLLLLASKIHIKENNITSSSPEFG